MSFPFVSDAPDATSRSIPAGMVQWHFIMSDDPIVKISDVQRAVGTELKIHGPKPRVVAADKVG